MRRVIKFRGLKGDGEWLYGSLWEPSEELTEEKVCVIFPKKEGLAWRRFRVLPMTVGQFTGLCDKNGKEIYEGDIVRTPLNIGVVRYNADRWFYEVAALGEPMNNERLDAGRPEDEWEVIGNIHEDAY